MTINRNKAFLATSLSIIGISAIASSVEIPSTFTAGSPALASEVNANFDAVKTAVDDNDNRIAQLEAQLSALIAANNATYSIGDTGPAGGIVFYVTALGKHGLEAAPVDLNGGSGVEWGCQSIEVNGADNTSIGGGAQNTADILAEGCTSLFGGPIAAELADSYSLGGFDDWYLPSSDELNQMYINLHLKGLGNFFTGGYLSSSESSSTHVLGQEFGSGGQGTSTKVDDEFNARAIRSF